VSTNDLKNSNIRERQAIAGNDHMPIISVVMPVFNGQRYLHDSIKSILDQTFTDFELIIIDDGSEDNSSVLVENFMYDKRVRLYKQDNIGLAATLNRGIRLSRGSIIARQDQDDISLPNRFTKQYDYLMKNPEVGMVGTWSKIINENGSVIGFHRHPTDNKEINYFLMRDNPFVHSSVMIRKSLLETIGGYSEDKSMQPPEDYELWTRMVKYSKLANLPEALVIYRATHEGMSRKPNEVFQERKIKISETYLRRILPNTYDSLMAQNIASYLHFRMPVAKKNTIEVIIAYTRVLSNHNLITRISYLARFCLSVLLTKIETLLPVIALIRSVKSKSHRIR